MGEDELEDMENDLFVQKLIAKGIDPNKIDELSESQIKNLLESEGEEEINGDEQDDPESSQLGKRKHKGNGEDDASNGEPDSKHSNK